MLSLRATPARWLFFVELLSLSLILFFVAPAFAGSGKIAGLVRDAGTGKPLPDATVRAFLLQNLHRDGDRWAWRANLTSLRDSLDVIGYIRSLTT